MDIDNIKERFVSNSRGFWKTHSSLLILFFIALLADGISTICFMLSEGVDSELHPVINFAGRIAGPVLGPLLGVFGKTVAGIIVAIYWRRIAWIILLVASIVSFWAAWYNIWGWRCYEPNILKWWPF